jgi:hypothetical protein
MASEPGVSLLFTGHMIDLPDRPEPRFPPSLEQAAHARIAAAIERRVSGLNQAARAAVLGFASGARGGDILFHEGCRSHQIDTVIVLPFDPDNFVKHSVDGIPDADWPERFWDLWNDTPPARRCVMGLPLNDQAFAICNEKLLERARRHGRVHLIALWDGRGADGPGGTADLVSRLHGEDEPDIFSPSDLRG